MDIGQVKRHRDKGRPQHTLWFVIFTLNQYAKCSLTISGVRQEENLSEG